MSYSSKLTLLLDKSLKTDDKHNPRFISNFTKSRHLETQTVDAIFLYTNTYIDKLNTLIIRIRDHTCL